MSALVAFLLVLALGIPLAASGAEPKASWTRIGPISLGTYRQLIERRYPEAERQSEDLYVIRVPGGRIGIGFTGRRRNRVRMIMTCAPIFLLPDGVERGIHVPSGRKWRGYTSTPDGLLWTKDVRTVGGVLVSVFLRADRGNVTCVNLAY